ncbi:MAG: hypothetical protein HY558_08575, partial [Euryarchaeota archaeon]|nr:hypothetical protein [Euryarchaeota archaeon]
MEPYEGPLRAAREHLAAANFQFGKVPPRPTFDLAHNAIHSFVEALSKSRGIRHKISHEGVAVRAEELGLPKGLVDAVDVVERSMPRIVYGGQIEVSGQETKFALETANRLAAFVARSIPAPGERVVV